MSLQDIDDARVENGTKNEELLLGNPTLSARYCRGIASYLNVLDFGKRMIREIID
jgi:hypothetical protein